MYAAYHLIALRGLRRGEAAGLRWRDVDLDGRAAFICEQLQQYDGCLAVCPPKTARSVRVIALDRTTVAALRAHRDRQRAEAVAFGPGWRASGYVFTGLNGDPMASDRLSRIFKELAAEAGLPPVRLHDLRHGAATLAQMGRIASDASFGRLRECVRPAAQLAAARRAPRAGTAGGRADLGLHRPRAADASRMRLVPWRGVRHRCAC
jgi:integrase